MRSLMKIPLTLWIGFFGFNLALAQSPAKPAPKKETPKRAVNAVEQPVAPQELSIAERVHVGHLALLSD